MNSNELNDDNLEETEGNEVNVNKEPSDPLEDRIIAPASVKCRKEKMGTK